MSDFSSNLFDNLLIQMNQKKFNSILEAGSYDATEMRINNNPHN